MGRHPIGEIAMSAAERQRRRRARFCDSGLSASGHEIDRPERKQQYDKRNPDIAKNTHAAFPPDEFRDDGIFRHHCGRCGAFAPFGYGVSPARRATRDTARRRLRQQQ